jgi:hypothetical protein
LLLLGAVLKTPALVERLGAALGLDGVVAEEKAVEVSEKKGGKKKGLKKRLKG